jgi:hypothetical protein
MNHISTKTEKKKRAKIKPLVVLLIFLAVLAVLIIVNSSDTDTDIAQNSITVEQDAISLEGIYRVESTRAENSFKQVIVYPYTKSEVRIYLELNKGAPSYNSGALYISLDINDEGRGTYINEYDSCELIFMFTEELLEIEGDLIQGSECGFGGNVYATSAYFKINNKSPEEFTTRFGKTYRFRDYSPIMQLKDGLQI